MYCDPSLAVAGKRPVRSENRALVRSSDGFRMRVCRIVVGSSWSSYCSSASEPSTCGLGELSEDVSLADEGSVLVGKIFGAGRRLAGAGGRWAWISMLVGKRGGAGRRLAGAGERWAWALVMARAL